MRSVLNVAPRYWIRTPMMSRSGVSRPELSLSRCTCVMLRLMRRVLLMLFWMITPSEQSQDLGHLSGQPMLQKLVKVWMWNNFQLQKHIYQVLVKHSDPAQGRADLWVECLDLALSPRDLAPWSKLWEHRGRRGQPDQWVLRVDASWGWGLRACCLSLMDPSSTWPDSTLANTVNSLVWPRLSSSTSSTTRTASERPWTWLLSLFRRPSKIYTKYIQYLFRKYLQIYNFTLLMWFLIFWF